MYVLTAQEQHDSQQKMDLASQSLNKRSAADTLLACACQHNVNPMYPAIPAYILGAKERVGGLSASPYRPAGNDRNWHQLSAARKDTLAKAPEMNGPSGAHWSDA